MTNQSEPALQIVAPAEGAVLSSPLAILRVRYRGATARTATIHVGQVRHVVELKTSAGELRENITLLDGENTLRVDLGDQTTRVKVTLEPSRNVTLNAPTEREAVATRATGVTGTYTEVSCPAGVIAVNGFMQQFSVRGTEGSFDEKIVLRPGANHVAVQIGERYVTRLVTGSFPPSKLLVTLVWDTPSTDVDLYVREPDGRTVYYSAKTAAGNLDVDRQQGFGPENYSLGVAGGKVAPGDYVVRVHYYADRGLGRTEWTVRVLSDEDSGAQQRRNFYGILDFSNSSGSAPGSTGRDWDEVCTIRVAGDGSVEIVDVVNTRGI